MAACAELGHLANVSPDGRMETVYKVLPDLGFDDGRPITAADFGFAGQKLSLDHLHEEVQTCEPGRSPSLSWHWRP